MGHALVPRPRTLVEGDGDVSVALGWVSAPRPWRPVVDRFARDHGALAEGRADRSRHGVGLVVASAPELGREGYRVTVDREVRVEAGGGPGLSYGLTTLGQLLEDARAAGRPGVLARVAIEDAPAWPWRGVHLDVARHFFSVADVCRFIDLCAAHKLNHLHLHLNDDQGWRVEVPAWPRLTQVGAWRASSPVGHERDGVDDHVAYGGYYDAADLATIRDHAAGRFVTVVPEIDLPGHAQAVIAAYPQLGHGETVDVWTRWGISDHVLNATEAALDFAVEVTGYVASLFPGSPVHIGGDECPTTRWAASPEDRAVMASRGFAAPRQLQGLFSARVASALREAGHEVLAWDEVLDAEAPPGTVVVAWRGADRALEAARRGHDVVMATQDALYLDWLNADASGEPVAQKPAPQVTTWERVYGFSVLPEGLAADLAHRVRGAQAELWTEYIATRDHLDYMAFPRLCAFAEVAWGTATTPEEFRARLATHLRRLAARAVRFRPLD